MVKQFKKYIYIIVKWKITKIVSRYQSNENATIEQCACSFVNDVNIFVKDSQLFDDQIFNGDQSSFNRKIHSGKTLDFVGSKHIESITQSVSSMTHSCTIMPIISKGGDYYPPLFIVLPEQIEKFGCTIKKTNLYLRQRIFFQLQLISEKWVKQNLKYS